PRDPALWPDAFTAVRAPAALHRGIRAELLHAAAGCGHAARIERGDARPRDGNAHARDLGTAARPRRGRAPHRRRWLHRLHASLRRPRPCGDGRYRLSLAPRALAAVGRSQRPSLDSWGLRGRVAFGHAYCSFPDGSYTKEI